MLPPPSSRADEAPNDALTQFGRRLADAEALVARRADEVDGSHFAAVAVRTLRARAAYLETGPALHQPALGLGLGQLVRRYDGDPADCPVAELLDTLEDRWMALVHRGSGMQAHEEYSVGSRSDEPSPSSPLEDALRARADGTGDIAAVLGALAAGGVLTGQAVAAALTYGEPLPEPALVCCSLGRSDLLRVEPAEIVGFWATDLARLWPEGSSVTIDAGAWWQATLTSEQVRGVAGPGAARLPAALTTYAERAAATGALSRPTDDPAAAPDSAAAIKRDLERLTSFAEATLRLAREQGASDAVRVLKGAMKRWRGVDPSRLQPPASGGGLGHFAGDTLWTPAQRRIPIDLRAFDTAWHELQLRAFALQGVPPYPPPDAADEPENDLEAALRTRDDASDPDLDERLRAQLSAARLVIGARQNDELLRGVASGDSVALFSSWWQVPPQQRADDHQLAFRLEDLARSWPDGREAVIDPGAPWQLALPAPFVLALRARTPPFPTGSEPSCSNRS